MAGPCTLSREQVNTASVASRVQRTLKQSVSLSGIGLFSGQKVNLTIDPADPDTGIIFFRSDLPEKPGLAATLDNVVSTPRCTILGNGTRACN